MAIKPGTLGRPTGPTHLTHEARSAATRARLIEAAIHCLRTYGYGATTTTLVAEIAQFSRGAMLHHFGTKVDLMLATAKYVVERQNQFIAAELEKYPPGRERFLGLTDVTWAALRQPEAIALLEIMMASRSDAALAERFPAVAEELAESQRRGAWSLAKAAGITDRHTVDAMGELHRAAMQGLSIQLMFVADPKSLDPIMSLLNDYKAFLADKLIEDAQKDGADAKRSVSLKIHRVWPEPSKAGEGG